MKQSILLLAFSFYASQIFAQITIERADYTFTADGGTVVSWNMSKAGLSLPAEGAGVVWDFSGQALTSSYEYSKSPVSDPTFPDANLVEYASGMALGIAPQNVSFYEQLDDEGYKTLGRITSSVTLPAQPLTGGPNDTITFLGTVSVYEEPIYYLKFPLVYGDTWDTDINIKGNYLMTVQAFGLDHVPASSNYNYVETNTVAGHGTLILPHPDGTGTVSMEALLLKSTTTRTDSFFLAGQPAPPVMLSVLGLVQGFTETETDYAFYAKGLNRSALYMEAENGEIKGIGMADDIRNVVSSTRFAAPNLAMAKVYPNPTTSDFQMEFEKTDAQSWTLHVYNPLGQQMKTMTVEGHPGQQLVNVSLPEGTEAGLYQIVLRNGRNEAVAAGRVLKN